MASRLSGRAYDLLVPKTQYGIPQFINYPALLSFLKDSFRDPDYVWNTQHNLFQLKQRNLEFSVFFSEFQRLAAAGDIPVPTLTPLLS